MGKGLGYQHQYYGYGNDGGMAQAQQQRGYAVYQQDQSWGSQNEYPQHKQFPGMHMKPPPPSSSTFDGGFGMHRESFEDGYYSSSSSAQYHDGYAAGAPSQFAYGGSDEFNYNGYGRREEVAEYDHGYGEQRYGAAGAMMKQKHADTRMKFERPNYGFDDRYGNIPPRPHHWTEKRV